MKFTLTLSALAAAAYAKTALMIPFYISPLAWQAEWDSLISTIDQHPALDFYIILNDQGGCPWGDPNFPCNPLSPGLRDYAKNLGKLHSRSNTKIIGYVATTFGKRDVAEVKLGVDDYRQWTTMIDWDGNTQNITMHGIFFDEIDTNPTQLQRNLEITNYAKSAFGDNVVLNPGVAVAAGSESLFDAATAILNLETCYTKDANKAYDGTPPKIVYRCPPGYTPFTPASLNSVPSKYASKSSVVIHDFYETWSPYKPASKATFEADATAIVKKGVHSFYISQYGYQGNFTMGPATISENARIAASVQGLA